MSFSSMIPDNLFEIMCNSGPLTLAKLGRSVNLGEKRPDGNKKTTAKLGPIGKPRRCCIRMLKMDWVVMVKAKNN